ncbi:glycosyltransferase family 39 protein [Pedobacter sp. Hv1]|uniref:glycosyltransferase family 39 protein n=1 Tax=Pedobacter sp. Hv1 TaxID=1740090 RepID=UPI0006D8A2DA|nr:glycosyltransferase family 39 protein [Pedobacter sp. Hv1]KQC02711.1 glycosyl transferase [Pedobacter sp. Hv1]
MLKKGTVLLGIFILVKMILQYVLVHPVYELHRDEFLHLDQAKHLAWGYHSVPPLTSWISWLILQLGNSVFWIRFFPALFGALTILVVWKTIESLKGSLFACFLAALGLTFSTLLRLNILYQPNSLDILCWTLLFYTLVRFIQTEQYKWLYLMAITFAIGFLNKYNIAFCLIALLPALVLSPQRKILLKPQFYGALALGLLIISPNLIWQFQNDFPVFKHLKELNDTQLVNVNRLDFVKEQIFFFLGSIFILIAAFVSFFSYPPFKPYRILFWTYVFSLTIFIFLRAKAYYAIGLYPIFFAFGAIYLSQISQKGWTYCLRFVVIAMILFFFWPLFRITMPTRTPEAYVQAAKEGKPFSTHTWEDGKKHPLSQDFADMLGWEELARKTDSVYNSLPDQQHVFILSNNYGETGAINYYTKVKGLTAHSFDADYINWMKLGPEIKTLIRIKEAHDTDLTREQSLFGHIVAVAKIENPYAREKGTQILVMTQPKVDINKIIVQELAQKKAGKD